MLGKEINDIFLLSEKEPICVANYLNSIEGQSAKILGGEGGVEVSYDMSSHRIILTSSSRITQERLIAIMRTVRTVTELITGLKVL